MTNHERVTRGLGQFTGRQLTTIIVAVAFVVVAYPFAADAASAAFSNNSASTPAVQGTNSNAKGIGVKGTGKKYGVYSNGSLGIAAGKSLACTGCVGVAALHGGTKGVVHNCSSAPFPGIDLAGCTLNSRTFMNADYAGGDLVGTNLSLSVLTSSNFDAANLDEVDLHGATLADAFLTFTDLKGADMTNVAAYSAYFMYADLTNATLAGASITGTDFTAAVMKAADMSGVDFTNSGFPHPTMTGADVSFANFTGADLTGADMTGVTDTSTTWSNTVCPDGTNSDDHSNTCSGHGAP
jgi:uncharacterized protein YjbI with pentapeptide repeats